MLVKDNANVTEGTIVGPDGSIINKPTVILSREEAAVMRAYKKLKLKYGFKEENRCNECWSGDRSDGMRGFVTDSQVLLECRCRMIFHQGQSY